MLIWELLVRAHAIVIRLASPASAQQHCELRNCAHLPLSPNTTRQLATTQVHQNHPSQPLHTNTHRNGRDTRQPIGSESYCSCSCEESRPDYPNKHRRRHRDCRCRRCNDHACSYCTPHPVKGYSITTSDPRERAPEAQARPQHHRPRRAEEQGRRACTRRTGRQRGRR
jgi:hypothetical protein